MYGLAFQSIEQGRELLKSGTKGQREDYPDILISTLPKRSYGYMHSIETDTQVGYTLLPKQNRNKQEKEKLVQGHRCSYSNT